MDEGENMSSASNDQGRAYEYICLITLTEEINKFRLAVIDKNSSYEAAQNAWNNIDAQLKEILTESAKAAVLTIFDLEPLIIEDGNDQLDLKIQKDSEGEIGDVRDILIIRRNIHWEIGLSVKHNHFAVKHSRLSPKIDFGKKWFGVECSNQYWNSVNVVFDYLKECKNKDLKWSELDDKENDVYIPILNAFVDEIKLSNSQHSDLPRKMVEYLLGEFDFYKVISIDNKRLTQIQTYNLRGTLNKPSTTKEAKIKVPISTLPTRIVSLDFKPNSKNTVELYMDNGWQFSFRIHNASTKVETSLKFDVQIIGMPATIQRLEKIKNAFVSPQFNQLSLYLQNNVISVVKSDAVNSLINLSDNIIKIVNKTDFTPFIKIFNDTVISIKYIQLLKEIKWPIFLINDSFLQEQIMSACENKIDEKATSNIITSYFTDDVLDIMEDDWTSCSLINEQRIPILKEAILMHRNSYYYASTSILMCQIYGIASDIINLAKDNGLELNDENKNMLSEQYNIDKKNIDKEKGKLI